MVKTVAKKNIIICISMTNVNDISEFVFIYTNSIKGLVRPVQAAAKIHIINPRAYREMASPKDSPAPNAKEAPPATERMTDAMENIANFCFRKEKKRMQ